ncbi:hypothetical protein CYMTET_8419, partial [Cymbomonas tetramitiformis]
DPVSGQMCRRRIISPNAAAAIFCKYGHSKEGLMPYDVFVKALVSAPARLLGMENILDNKEEGRNGLGTGDDPNFDGKILYPKCRKGVFPPIDFDERCVERSGCPPKATMRLEHVYGYAGLKHLANNIFFLYTGEVVYYTAAVGVVFDKAKMRAKQRSQRYFYGHDNDIRCLNLHPNRRFVITGQQVEAGSVPYACIWDAAEPAEEPTDACRQLQKLEHPKGMRSVIAVAFSNSEVMRSKTSGRGAAGGAGDAHGGDPSDSRGRIVVTCCSDNRHTCFVWEWMRGERLQKRGVEGPEPGKRASDELGMGGAPQVMPAWYYGPANKAQADFYPSWNTELNPDAHHEFQTKRFRAASVAAGAMATPPDNGKVPKKKAQAAAAAEKAEGGEGGDDAPPLGVCGDGTMALLDSFPGQQGTPPQVYGVVFNPFKEIRYRVAGEKLVVEGGEFVTYGVNHLRTWNIMENTWVGTYGTFGNDKVDIVLSAVFVPRQLNSRDCTLVTGFPDGSMGVWIPNNPLPGCSYKLVQLVRGHGPGPPIYTSDGKVTHSGVRVLKLRQTNETLLSGGADGCVVAWDVRQVADSKGAIKMYPMGRADSRGNPIETTGPSRFELAMPFKELQSAVVGLDSLPSLPNCFIAGTNKCEIWEVDKDPEVLIFGHAGDLYGVAAHPKDPTVFASVSEAARIYVWDTSTFNMSKTASLTFRGSAVGFSEEPIPAVGHNGKEIIYGWKPEKGSAHHLAVGGMQGRIQIMDADNLLPLKLLKDAGTMIQDIKYTPASCKEGALMAAASNDLVIDIYNVLSGYTHVARCVGHSATVSHIDWSLPLSNPPELRGKTILMSNCNAYEILYWDPMSGKQLKQNQRNAQWHTWTCILGFRVMGIWPDGSDGTDVNALAPTASAACGFVVTGDDYEMVKLFNYPVVADDAPFRAYRGHASHVMGICFTCDDRHVISAGGKDRAVMQWRTHGIAPLGADGQVDEVSWCDTDACEHCGRQKPQPPKPPPAWGPLKGPGGSLVSAQAPPAWGPLKGPGGSLVAPKPPPAWGPLKGPGGSLFYGPR